MGREGGKERFWLRMGLMSGNQQARLHLSEKFVVILVYFMAKVRINTI